MASQPSLLPSILDRLTDPEPRGSSVRPGYSLDQMARSIEDDLERLLNSRSDDSEEMQAYPRYAGVVGFGLPDLATMTRLQDLDSQTICNILETKILKYEPRLKGVRISLRECNDPLRIQLQLQGILAVDDAPEMLIDKTLDLASGHFLNG